MLLVSALKNTRADGNLLCQLPLRAVREAEQIARCCPSAPSEKVVGLWQWSHYWPELWLLMQRGMNEPCPHTHYTTESAEPFPAGLTVKRSSDGICLQTTRYCVRCVGLNQDETGFNIDLDLFQSQLGLTVRKWKRSSNTDVAFGFQRQRSINGSKSLLSPAAIWLQLPSEDMT